MAVQLACREGSARLEVRGIRAREEWGPQTGKGSPGGRGRARTLNMSFMLLMAERSKSSGWLNFFAPCRESKEGHAMRGEAYGSGGSRRRTTTAHAACKRGRDCRLGAGHGEEIAP